MCMPINFWSTPISLEINDHMNYLFENPLLIHVQTIRKLTFGPIGEMKVDQKRYFEAKLGCTVHRGPKVSWYAHGSRDYLLQISELDQKLDTRV